LTVRRSRLPRCASALSAAASDSPQASTPLRHGRAVYFGSVTPARRNHCRTVFRDKPVRLATSRIDRPSRSRIRRIFANIPTLITPAAPCSFLKQGTAYTWVKIERSHPA
jgi:hypothetical protein